MKKNWKGRKDVTYDYYYPIISQGGRTSIDDSVVHDNRKFAKRIFYCCLGSGIITDNDCTYIAELLFQAAHMGGFPLMC